MLQDLSRAGWATRVHVYAGSDVVSYAASMTPEAVSRLALLSGLQQRYGMRDTVIVHNALHFLKSL